MLNGPRQTVRYMNTPAARVNHRLRTNRRLGVGYLGQSSFYQRTSFLIGA